MKKISLILILILLVTLVSCKTETEAPAESMQNEVQENAVQTSLDPLWENAFFLEDTAFGEGEKKIEVEVTAGKKSITFTINTNAEFLSEALLEHSLIEGEDSAYGIYIKKVNGILADYDEDKHYWSLTKNGEYLMTGADSTKIADSEHYEIVRTK